MNWEEVKKRHHVKLKPYLFIEGTLTTIVEDEVERGRKEALEGVLHLIIHGEYTRQRLKLELERILRKYK